MGGRWTGQRKAAALLALGAWGGQALAQPAPPPGDAAAALTRTIESLDKALFDAYNDCDLDKFGALFDTEVEFHHDKSGLMRTRQAVVEATRKHICGKVRRELVPGTMQVYAMDGYGALQSGSHRFCETGSVGCQGVGKYMQLWRLRDGAWQVTRVISYDHRALALPEPPAAPTPTPTPPPQ